jgi:hypothetical protein
MKIFQINFKIGCLELEAIVTKSDNEQRFKIELVTGEPDPIIMHRTEGGTWIIEQSGGRSVPEEGYHAIQKEIEARQASVS